MGGLAGVLGESIRGTNGDVGPTAAEGVATVLTVTYGDSMNYRPQLRVSRQLMKRLGRICSNVYRKTALWHIAKKWTAIQDVCDAGPRRLSFIVLGMCILTPSIQHHFMLACRGILTLVIQHHYVPVCRGILTLVIQHHYMPACRGILTPLKVFKILFYFFLYFFLFLFSSLLFFLSCCQFTVCCCQGLPSTDMSVVITPSK